MKKTTFANLIIIVSLLILCVMTLTAIYATAPDSSVLLLDENFNRLDLRKWKHEISECKEDGEQYHYMMEKDENSLTHNKNTIFDSLTANGVFLIQPNLTDVQFRKKRKALSHCISCVNSKNSSANCFVAKLQTRNIFNVSCGRIEVRAKLRSENLIRFYIKITPSRNNSETEKELKSFLKSADEKSTNNSAEFEISFETVSNEVVVRSAITDDEFHVYEINWDVDKISLTIDKEKVHEKRLKEFDSKGESISNKTVNFSSTSISEPFFLNVGVDLRGMKQTNLSPEDENTSPKDSVNYDLKDLKEERKIFQMDYIRLFRNLN